MPLADASSVYTLDISTGLESARTTLSRPGDARAIALNGDGTECVVVTHDPTSGVSSLERFAVPGLAGLGGIALSTPVPQVTYNRYASAQLDRNGDTLFLAAVSGAVVVDVATGVVRPVPGDPHHTVLDPTGRRVMRSEGAGLVVGDAVTGAVLGRFAARGADAYTRLIEFAPHGRFAAVTRLGSDGVEVFGVGGATPIRWCDLSRGFGEEADGPYALVFASDGGRGLQCASAVTELSRGLCAGRQRALGVGFYLWAGLRELVGGARRLERSSAEHGVPARIRGLGCRLRGEVWVDSVDSARLSRCRASGGAVSATGEEVSSTNCCSFPVRFPALGRTVAITRSAQWFAPQERFLWLDLVQDTAVCAPGTLKATGNVATLSVEGHAFAGAPLVFTVDGLKTNAMPGYLRVGSAVVSPTPLPWGLGSLCLGGSLGRYISQIQLGDAAGRQGCSVDTQHIPLGTGPTAVQAGSTWALQVWIHDLAQGGAAASNTSTARTVRFD